MDSDNNSPSKNHNADGHHESNLNFLNGFGGNKDDSDTEGNQVDDLMKNLEGLKTTETDMLWQYFANEEKMVDEDEVKLFEKPERKDSPSSSDRYKKYDSDSDDYHRRSDDHHHDDHHDDSGPKPSDYGPSFGEGPSVEGGSRSSYRDHSDEFESEEEEMLAKLDMLRKLGELTQYGVKLSQNYNMKSDYKAMKYEYELHRSIRDKRNGVKWLNSLMLNVCYGVELANEKYNPFDFHLKGWSEQMNDDIGDYDDVFGELYDKYFKAGKPIPPELKLFFLISGSAIKFHFANSMMSSLPGVAQMMNANPHLADQLRQQAASDKIRQQNQKQRDLYNEGTNKAHDEARQKAEDVNMLKQKQEEFEYMQQMQQLQQQQQLKQMQQQFDQQLQQQMNAQMNQQLEEKHKQLQDLENQLNMARSDSRSMYNSQSEQRTMKPPTMPSSLRPNTRKFPQNSTEAYRQQEILKQKQSMREQYGLPAASFNNNDTASYDGSSYNINPDIDNIINSGFKKDSFSKVSEISTLDGSDLDSENSKVVVNGKRRRRRKKSAIKIDT